MVPTQPDRGLNSNPTRKLEDEGEGVTARRGRVLWVWMSVPLLGFEGFRDWELGFSRKGVGVRYAL